MILRRGTDAETKNVFLSRDVLFDENRFVGMRF